MDSESRVVEIGKPDSGSNKPYYYGFGGWLYLFGAALIFQFINTVISLHENYKLFISENFKVLTDISSQSYNALWKPTIIFEMGVQALCLIVMLTIAYYCIKLSPRFRAISIWYIASVLVLNLIDVFLLSMIQNGYSEELFPQDSMYDSLIRSFWFAVIWVPYLLLSKRVKNTYGNSSVVYSREVKSSTIIPAILGGTMAIAIFACYIAYLIIYFWSSYIGFVNNGWLGTVITLFLPFFAQVYWLFHEWSTGSGYATLCIITVCVHVVAIGIAAILSKKYE